MPFVTKLTLTSGDRRVLEDVVGDIKEAAQRKGAELKGPHPLPPEDKKVPQHKRLHADGGRFDPWRYTVYTRRIEIIGHDDFARGVAGQDYPDGVRVEAEVEQRRSAGKPD